MVPICPKLEMIVMKVRIGMIVIWLSFDRHF
jgi:hypothetical protein